MRAAFCTSLADAGATSDRPAANGLSSPACCLRKRLDGITHPDHPRRARDQVLAERDPFLGAAVAGERAQGFAIGVARAGARLLRVAADLGIGAPGRVTERRTLPEPAATTVRERWRRR